MPALQHGVPVLLSAVLIIFLPSSTVGQACCGNHVSHQAHLLLVLNLLPLSLSQVCCGNAAANQVNLIMIETQLQSFRSQYLREMQERRDEEKCANKILQDQLVELQEKLNTHINICVYAYGFKAAAKSSGGPKFKAVGGYRDVLIDNSRDGKGQRVKPKELIDMKTGKFKVPKGADGDYQFTASISADTFQRSDRPWHRPAAWAILQEGKEDGVVKELVNVGDEFSAGLMVGSAGNNETADSVSLSKTILITLKEGDQVYVGALKIGEYFPYAGLYISFCATLLQKKTTEVESSAFTGEKPSTVLGPRFKCAPKIAEEIPEPAVATLTSTLAAEKSAQASEEAEKKKAKASTPAEKQAAEDEEKKKQDTIKEEEKESKAKTKEKEEEAKKVSTAKEEAKQTKEEEKKEEAKQKRERVLDSMEEPKAEGEEKWYVTDCYSPDCTNRTVFIFPNCKNETTKGKDPCEFCEDALKLGCEKKVENCCMLPDKYMAMKQKEVGCYHSMKMKKYCAESDKIIVCTDSAEKNCTTAEENDTTKDECIEIKAKHEEKVQEAKDKNCNDLTTTTTTTTTSTTSTTPVTSTSTTPKTNSTTTPSNITTTATTTTVTTTIATTKSPTTTTTAMPTTPKTTSTTAATTTTTDSTTTPSEISTTTATTTTITTATNMTSSTST